MDIFKSKPSPAWSPGTPGTPAVATPLPDVLGSGGIPRTGSGPSDTITPPAAPTPAPVPTELTSPKAPSAPATIPTPDPTSPAAMQAAKRAQAAMLLGGRASTILTGTGGRANRNVRPAPTLDYSKSTLGAG